MTLSALEAEDVKMRKGLQVSKCRLHGTDAAMTEWIFSGPLNDERITRRDP